MQKGFRVDFDHSDGMAHHKLGGSLGVSEAWDKMYRKRQMELLREKGDALAGAKDEQATIALAFEKNIASKLRKYGVGTDGNALKAREQPSAPMGPPELDGTLPQRSSINDDSGEETDTLSEKKRKTKKRAKKKKRDKERKGKTKKKKKKKKRKKQKSSSSSSSSSDSSSSSSSSVSGDNDSRHLDLARTNGVGGKSTNPWAAVKSEIDLDLRCCPRCRTSIVPLLNGAVPPCVLCGAQEPDAFVVQHKYFASESKQL